MKNTHAAHEAADDERLDKWLWAARFFKTRSLATAAVSGGKVRVNGLPAKPARAVKIGDTLLIQHAEQEWTVVVRGLNPQRRPASEAQQLYEETADSLTARAASKEARRLAPEPGASIKGRPTKQDRRRLSRLF